MNPKGKERYRLPAGRWEWEQRQTSTIFAWHSMQAAYLRYTIYTLRWANGRACITRCRTHINVCTLTKIKKQQYYKIYLIIYENVTRESFSFSQLCEWLNGSDSGCCCCCCHFSIYHNFPEQNESKHLHTHAHTQRQRTKTKEWPNEIMISKSLVLVYRVCNLWKPWIWKPGLRSYTDSRKGLI